MIDPFPVPVDLLHGMVLVPATTKSQPAAGPPTDQILATIDTLSPITVVDSFVLPGPPPNPQRRQVDLVLYDATSPTVARARFDAVSAFDLHPCAEDAACQVGTDLDMVVIGAIVGADVLSRTAVRFDFPMSSVDFFPDIAGDDAARGRACDAVFSAPFAGGGTLSIGGAEVTFGSFRIALGTCLHYDVEATEAAGRGTAALFIVATGLSTTILSESAYQRYASQVDDPAVAPAADTLPPIQIHLPSGTVSGRRGTLTRLALVGEGSNIRGPCQELWANHLMARELCYDADAGIGPCPCVDASPFCSTGAAIELDTAIDIAIVSDLDPLLQSLREELRPNWPEVDGLLGVNALAKLGLDVDYPNDRVVARCVDPVDCVSRPAVRTRNSLPEITGCPGMR